MRPAEEISSAVNGPVFGRTAVQVRVDPRGRAGLRRVGMVVEASVASPVEVVHGTERAELPKAMVELLRAATTALEAGDPVTLVVGSGDAEELTSQQVADLLGVSRPHVVKLARAGVLPHRRVGNRHRFRRPDVVAYQVSVQRRRADALARLAPAEGYQPDDF